MSIYKAIYHAGILFRNRKIFECYRKLKESEKWDMAELKRYQLQKLQELVAIAYNNSPYYRAKFEAVGVTPRSVRSLKDIELLPIMTKEEVLANAGKIQVSDIGEKVFFSETSGSSGTPLIFYRNEEWDAWHNASVMRGFSWHGVNLWEKNGYLWGYNIAPEKRLKIKALDLLQNRFRLFSYKDHDIDRFLYKLKGASYIGGYSSMLYEIAKRVNVRNIASDFDLKLVKGTSEKIYDAYQTEVKKAFGKKIISEYGSAEGGIIAFECTQGNMHLNLETAFAEIIDNEIVITNLVSKSFPIIRYKLGDYVTIDDATQCKCGMMHPVVKEVTGRVGELVRGKKSTYPSLTLYYVFKNLALEKQLTINYQVVQEMPGKAVCIVDKALTTHETLLLSSEFKKYFGDDLDVTVKVGRLRDDYTRKRKDFITKLQS